MIAKQIKSVRRSKRWTQEQLANRASIQRSYLADLERGCRNPSVRTLLKVANAIGLPICSLFIHKRMPRSSR